MRPTTIKFGPSCACLTEEKNPKLKKKNENISFELSSYLQFWWYGKSPKRKWHLCRTARNITYHAPISTTPIRGTRRRGWNHDFNRSLILFRWSSKENFVIRITKKLRISLQRKLKNGLVYQDFKYKRPSTCF